MHGWRVTSSRTAYENPWLRVREDLVIRPDGSDGLYGVVQLTGEAVFVVALTDDDEVVLVQLYRYPTRVVSLEIPSGGTGPDEPLAAARRELREETGITAREWTALGTLDPMNGIADVRHHVFLARGLTREVTDDTRHEQVLEGITDVRLVRWGRVLGMLAAGEITDADTASALLLAAVHLGRVH